MSVLTKIKEFFFGPAVSVPGKHPLDGPTKKAIIEPAPVAPPPAPAPAPVEPVAEVKVEAPAPAPAPAPEKPFVVTPTEWPFPTGEKPAETFTAPATSTSEIKVKKPRKPRAPKAPPVPMIAVAPKAEAKPKAKGKKK